MSKKQADKWYHLAMDIMNNDQPQRILKKDAEKLLKRLGFKNGLMTMERYVSKYLRDEGKTHFTHPDLPDTMSIQLTKDNFLTYGPQHAMQMAFKTLHSSQPDLFEHLKDQAQVVSLSEITGLSLQ